jgi:pimeloyl-ACP methyl ester carboxylesterase
MIGRMDMSPRDAISIRNGLAGYRLGSGEPILLMPGPHRFQRPGLRGADALITGLTALGREVITYDPPGSGRSTRAARVGMEEMIDCTDEVLDRHGVSRPIDALGHSMGGFALLAYALVRSNRCSRLVLVGTGAGGYLEAPGALWNRGHPHFARMAMLGILQRIWPRLGPEQVLRNLIERESFVDRSLARPTPVAFRDWLRPKLGRTDWHEVARRIDNRGRLGRITVPTLVLCGRHDPQFPVACSSELVAGITGAQGVIFERSGHYPFIEEPAVFWATVDQFLRTATPDPRKSSCTADDAVIAQRAVLPSRPMADRSGRAPGS